MDEADMADDVAGMANLRRTVSIQSEFSYEDFFENGIVALHVVGPDGVIQHANKAELELLGYGADEYIGHHLADFYKDRDVLDELLTRLKRGENVNRHRVRMRARNGSIKHVQVTSSPQFQDGVFISSRCFTVDVTDLEVTRAALDRKDDQFRQILESLPVAVYTTDRDGKITYFNRAAADLAGREPEIGKDEWCVTFHLFTPDGKELPHAECPMAVALKENRPVRNVEAIAQRPDGTFFPFLPYPTPLRDRLRMA